MSFFGAALFATSLQVSNPYREVDVCFVLDTTGSMSSLIATAKEKIWFIANEIVRAPGNPDVRFCLLGYRDRGDEYVTRHFDLTDDLDFIHEQLLEFEAGGGGDTPEAVNQALYEAIGNTAWSTSPEVLRLVFIVGDAPPHTDYDEPQYPDIARNAASRGITINPVLVGSDHATGQAFDQVASINGGQALRIDAAASSRPVATSVDQDLAVLGPRLARTTIPYGPADAQQTFFDRVDRSEDLSDAAASDRLSYQLAARAAIGSNDLLEALDRGDVNVDSINPEWLPESVRSMTSEELEEHLATVRTERGSLRRLIHSLVEERRSVVEASRDASGFESQVSSLIVAQMK